MNERMDGASYVFTDGPPRWCTSSLTYLFSKQPLTWATTSALSWLPAGSFAASATQVFFSRSFYSAFSSLQLQSRKTPAVTMRLGTSSCKPACQEHHSITHALQRAPMPMRFVTAGCKPAKQEPFIRAAPAVRTFGSMLHPTVFYAFYVKSSSRNNLMSCASCRPYLPSAPNETVFWHLESSWHANRDFAGLIFQKCSERDIFSHFEVQIELSLKSGAHFADLYLPKVLWMWVLTSWSANRALAAVLHAHFCQQLLQIEPGSRGNRDPTSATPKAT